MLALAGIARWLGLGGAPTLADEGEARDALRHIVPSFVPRETWLDTRGCSALLLDDAGRVALLRAHGARWAARVLPLPLDARVEDGRLLVPSGERMFGRLELEHECAAELAARLRSDG